MPTNDSAAGLPRQTDYFYSLIEASKILNSTLDVDELLEDILRIALKNTNAEAGTIYLIDDKKGEIWSKISVSDKKQEIRLKLGHGIAGNVALSGETINLESARSHPRFTRIFDSKTGFVTKSMLCMPLKNGDDKIVGVFQIMNSREGKFSAFDEKFLTGLSEHAAIALARAEMHRQALEAEAIKNEMEMARRIQEGLLPKSGPRLDGFLIDGKTLPAKVVGGDYYDYLVTENGWLRFCVADVCGKGVPAALLMATIRTAFHVIKTDNTVASISRFGEDINKTIFNSSPAASFSTMYYGELNLQTGELLYFNAGHNQPVVVNREGAARQLVHHNMALGLVRNSEFVVWRDKLVPGDTLLVFSDGVTEAMNAAYEEFGEDRLQKILRRSCGKNCSDLIVDIVGSVAEFAGDWSHTDDLTLLCIQRTN